MKFLEIENLRKVYGSQVSVQRFDIAVERGEFISFLGPSGCGKTTTLRMIAGFEQPSGGSIRIDGRDVVGSRCGTTCPTAGAGPPGRRPVRRPVTAPESSRRSPYAAALPTAH